MKKNEILIEVNNISKTFKLGQFISPTHYLKQLLFSKKTNKFQALKNISFKVHRGEKIGILGKNGSGKSTLLKIISGVTIPSSGNIKSNCKIVPLLGIGAGFDMELSMEENIYIYAAILNIKQKNLKKLLPNILGFSELDKKFLDTPLKRFSKGMKVRLGMSIALTLKPDLLIVDEVLAAGDIAFREKCMREVEKLCEKGMSLLFVSHSPSRVRRLCNKAILIRSGEMVMMGDSSLVLNEYLNHDMRIEDLDIDDDDKDNNIIEKEKIFKEANLNYLIENNELSICLKKIQTLDIKGKPKSNFDFDEEIIINFFVNIKKVSTPIYPRVTIFYVRRKLFECTSTLEINMKNDIQKISFNIPKNIFFSGTYSIRFGLFSNMPMKKMFETNNDVLSFKVNNPGNIVPGYTSDIDLVNSKFLIN